MKKVTFGKVRRDKAGRLVWTPSRKAYSVITQCAKAEGATYQATGNKLLKEALRRELPKVVKALHNPCPGDYGQLLEAVLRFRMNMVKGGAK